MRKLRSLRKWILKLPSNTITPIRMNTIEKIDDYKCGLEFGATRTLGRCDENINQLPLIKLIIYLSYNLVNPHLIIYPREMQTYVYIKTYISIFIRFIYTTLKLKTTKMSNNRWMVKQMVVYSTYPAKKWTNY